MTPKRGASRVSPTLLRKGRAVSFLSGGTAMCERGPHHGRSEPGSPPQASDSGAHCARCLSPTPLDKVDPITDPGTGLPPPVDQTLQRQVVHASPHTRRGVTGSAFSRVLCPLEQRCRRRHVGGEQATVCSWASPLPVPHAPGMGEARGKRLCLQGTHYTRGSTRLHCLTSGCWVPDRTGSRGSECWWGGQGATCSRART